MKRQKMRKFYVFMYLSTYCKSGVALKLEVLNSANRKESKSINNKLPTL